jgi:Ser/Thr protein kinase RdoA (MazF antagonist)
VPGRVVTLVLCTGDGGRGGGRAGEVLGGLAPFDVPSPWWPDAAEVVAGARARHGIDVVVLRLLSVEAAEIVDGGPATYLAQVDPTAPGLDRSALTPWPGDPLADDPARMPWARPGGPQADVAWAQDVAVASGLDATGAPEQVRTWNLSSIWRLPTDAGPAWLKVVPAFFAHEGDLLAALAAVDPGAVPELIGHEGARMLLRDVPGSDRHDATGGELAAMVHGLVALQAAWRGRTRELLALGVPDWRPPAYLPDIEALLARAGTVDAATARVLERLVGSLPERLAAIEACGVPDTLVHGDFHPGNLRGDAGHLRMLDWGDSGVGNPLLDETAFCQRLSHADMALARTAFEQEWRAVVPGCDPARAADLLGPVAALRAAVVYQRFLDAIEPSEHPYHRDDPASWLRRAAALAAEPR